MADGDMTKWANREGMVKLSLILLGLGIVLFYAFGVVTLQNGDSGDLYVDLQVDQENQTLWVVHSAGEEGVYDHVSVTVSENVSSQELVVFQLSSDSSYGVVSRSGVSLGGPDITEEDTVIRNGSVPPGSNVTVTVHKVYSNGSKQLLRRKGFHLY